MLNRPRLFDDFAGVAGGAFSIFRGIREEVNSLVRHRIDESLTKLDIVRRDELDIAQDMASRARLRIEELERRVDELNARVAQLETASHPTLSDTSPT